MAHPGRRPNRAWAYFSSSNVLAEASASIRFGPLGRVPPEDIDYNVFEVFLQSVGPGSVVLEIAPARDCTCAAITSLRDGLGSRVSSRESIARISSMVALKSRSEPSCAQVRSTLPRESTYTHPSPAIFGRRPPRNREGPIDTNRSGSF